MKAKSKLIKYTTLLSGYSLGIFLNQGLNLILIPILWQVLKPEDFGIIAITQLLNLFLNPIYLLGATDTVQRFYYKWTEEQRQNYLGWYFWFMVGFSFLLTLILDLLARSYSGYVIKSVPYDPYIRLTLWSIFAANLLNFPIAVSRIQQKIKTYNLLYCGSVALQFILVYYLVIIKQTGVAGYIEGFFYANLLWLIPIFLISGIQFSLWPSRRLMYIPLRFAVPLCFSGIIDGISTSLDRYFLDKYVPLASIGFYNLARQGASLVNIINSVVKLVFLPYIYKINALSDRTRQILSDFSLTYGVFMTIPTVAVCTMTAEAVAILDPTGTYQALVPYVPYFAVAFYTTSLAMAMGRGTDLAGITTWNFMVPLTGIVVSLFVYWLTLPEMGIFGILLSLLIGTVARNFVNVWMGYYYFKRPLYLGKLVASWIAAIAAYYVLNQIALTNPYVSILAKVLILLALLATLFKLVVSNHIFAILDIGKTG